MGIVQRSHPTILLSSGACPARPPPFIVRIHCKLSNKHPGRLLNVNGVGGGALNRHEAFISSKR